MSAKYEFDKTDPDNKRFIASANVGEPMFVLLARDPAMYEVIMTWVHFRAKAISQGDRPDSPEEAAHLLKAMRMARRAKAYYEQLHAKTKQQLYEEQRKGHIAHQDKVVFVEPKGE